MKKALRSLVIVAALGSAAHAAPFLAMGDSAELFLTGTIGVRADDNILLGSAKTSDTVFEFVPGFDVLYGQNALTKGNFFYHETISRFNDNTKLNTSLSAVGFNAKYDNQKTKMNFNTSYTQLAQNTVDARPTAPPTGTKADFIRRDVFHIEGGSEISITDKSSAGAAVAYENIDYKRSGFASSKITEVPLNYYFNMLPKVDMSFGFTYRDTKLESPGINSSDYFYNVGARGEFTPKLTGKFAIGYTTRKMATGPSQNTLGLQSSFAYAVDEKTSLTFGVTNDYGVAGNGQNQRNLTWNAGFQSKISDNWSVGATGSYRTINYLGVGARSDDYFEGTLTASYVLSTNVNFSAGYTFRSNSSQLAGSTFNNNVFSVAANFRY